MPHLFCFISEARFHLCGYTKSLINRHWSAENPAYFMNAIA